MRIFFLQCSRKTKLIEFKFQTRISYKKKFLSSQLHKEKITEDENHTNSTRGVFSLCDECTKKSLKSRLFLFLLTELKKLYNNIT